MMRLVIVTECVNHARRQGLYKVMPRGLIMRFKSQEKEHYVKVSSLEYKLEPHDRATVSDLMDRNFEAVFYYCPRKSVRVHRDFNIMRRKYRTCNS